MQVSVTGHHVEDHRPAAQPTWKRNVWSAWRGTSDHVMDAHCVLTVEKLLQQAPRPRCTCAARPCMPWPRIDENMYAAIDALTDKLERLVRRHKEKITDHHAAEAQKGARR